MELNEQKTITLPTPLGQRRPGDRGNANRITSPTLTRRSLTVS
jgi:hypothetical protein